MNKTLKLALLIGIPLIGVVAGYLLMARTVQVSVDGHAAEVDTHALTVKGALRSAGYHVEPGDQVIPPENTWLSKTTGIVLNRSSLIRIWIDPKGELVTLETPGQTPAEILRAAGIEPAAEDEVLINGEPCAMEEMLERRAGLTLQYRPAAQAHLLHDGQAVDFKSAAPTLGLALWQQGIHVSGGDRLTSAFDQPWQDGQEISLDTARAIEISVDGGVVTSVSAAATVGEAVKTTGISLQGIDYTKPAENDPLPADGKIQVVRVTEEVIMEQSAVAYETEMLADPALEVNQQKVIEEGQNGIQASRVRVRYEDGVEVSRTNEENILLVAPVTRVVHYGSSVVDKTIDTPNGPITYYMSANVIATSYSPCRSGVEGKCYTGTSLGIPVQKGVIGVHRAWYNMFKGTQIYVPGYGVGTIADIGYYPYSDNWIDLGYTDADYEPWYSVSLTIYFLSPAPAGFTGALP